MRGASERAEAVLATREAEFRAIFATAAAGVIEVDATSRRYLRVNRRFCQIVGRSEAELVGRLGPEDLCYPGERERVPLLRALDRGEEKAEGEYRLQRPDATVVWVRASAAVSARGARGRRTRFVSVLQDVTERHRAEEARELLAREVDHRAKNALAVVQAALRLTPKTDLPTYVKAVEGRVTALARAQSLLADSHGIGADLRALAEAELGAFAARPDGGGGSQTLDITGPPMSLSPSASHALAMTLHELTTNPTKHGALSRPGGQVKLTWNVDETAGLLRLRWMESGGPPPGDPPQRLGLGSRVIRAMVEKQLGGTLMQTWGNSGLVCEALVPLSRSLAGQEVSPRG